MYLELGRIVSQNTLNANQYKVDLYEQELRLREFYDLPTLTDDYCRFYSIYKTYNTYEVQMVEFRG